MQINKMKKSLGISLLLGVLNMATASAETMTLDRVLQTALTNSLPLQIAAMQTERAALESDKVNSKLGWNVTGKTNFDHDVGFTGTPSNKLNTMAGMSRMLPNGDVIGGNANYSIENSEFVFSKEFPNPAHRINLDLSYRKPLQQGAGNPLFHNGLIKAEAGTALSEESRLVLQDNFTTQVVETYYASLLIQASIKNNKQAMERAERLITFIKKNTKLGLAEEKDLLQVVAQLQSLKADQSSLQLAWLQQSAAINRLMGRAYQDKFKPVMPRSLPALPDKEQTALDEAISYSPSLRIQDAKIKLAETMLDDLRNNNKNKLDLVMSIGTRSAYGKNGMNNTVNETDYALMAGVEYSRAVDKRGIVAELEQAMMDRTIALREIENIKLELNYAVYGLLQEITATDAAINQYVKRVTREQQKLNEAESRYHRGRTTTQELIMFENDLSIAKFLLQQKRIDLAHRYARLNLLRGGMAQRLMPLTMNKKGE
ncbi:MAG: TolC family protein [Gammaproteobacteria bacterium]|nr:TolC family protein [Gammaproteobacteria bacterium]